MRLTPQELYEIDLAVTKATLEANASAPECLKLWLHKPELPTLASYLYPPTGHVSKRRSTKHRNWSTRPFERQP